MSDFRLTPFSSVTLIFIIYTFSYNFHSLWVLADVILLVWLFFIQVSKFKIRLFTLLVGFVTFSYLFYALAKSSFHFISFLSIWDTLKHLILIHVFYRLLRNEQFSQKLIKSYIPFTVAFYIQFLLCILQYSLNVYHDDIAGSFGEGSSHSIAYFTLAYLAFLYFKQASLIEITIALFCSSIINVIAENIGFFFILFLVLFTIMIKSKYRYFYLFAGFSGLILIFLLFSETEFLLATQNRLSMMFAGTEYTGQKFVPAERGIMTAYAFYLGGVFGAGPGAYSEIYSLTGWLHETLILKQVNISEVSHLIAEYGILGLILITVLYLTTLLKFGSTLLDKVIIGGLLIFAMLYNRLLMDERIIFFLLITIMLLSKKVKTTRAIKT